MADHPLTEDDCKTCNLILDNVGPALEMAAKCKDCGFPVDEFIDQLTQQRNMAQKIKANFFPNRP